VVREAAEISRGGAEEGSGDMLGDPPLRGEGCMGDKGRVVVARRQGR